MRRVTDCKQATRISHLYKLGGIASPNNRREAATRAERWKQLYDKRHLLFEQCPPALRHKSRKSCLDKTRPLQTTKLTSKLKRKFIKPSETIPIGAEWKCNNWKTLNRFRAVSGRCQKTLKQMGYDNDIKCLACSEMEDLGHFYTCPRQITVKQIWEDEQLAMYMATSLAKRI